MPKTNGSHKRSAASLIRYLPCKAEPGMFKGELLVYLHGLHPERRGESIRVQMLVDEQEVKALTGEPKRNNPVSGWLKVSLGHEEGGVAEVVLPQPAQPVGESLLVRSSELKKAV